jgi:hypothetical protein
VKLHWLGGDVGELGLRPRIDPELGLRPRIPLVGAAVIAAQILWLKSAPFPLGAWGALWLALAYLSLGALLWIALDLHSRPSPARRLVVLLLIQRQRKRACAASSRR